MIEKVLKDLACESGELSILFTDDSHIEALNRQYLGREGPTNVLSFPMSGESSVDNESGMMGDVVISVDTAIREAEIYEEPLDDRVYLLLIHGILHLMGYDHERSAADGRIMAKEEKRLLSLVKEEH
jgi:probable rRNA maturation factor